MDPPRPLRRAWELFARHPLVGQALVLLALDLAIHGRLLLDFGGYISWGNFLTAYTASQYPSGPALSWSPYQYGGTEVGLPFANLVGYAEATGPLAVLSTAFGATAGTKLYIVLSTLGLGVAAILFVRTLVRHPLGQLAGGAFVMAGPFQLALYGQGDYQEFVAEALVFLAIVALWEAIRRPAWRWLWFPVAGWLILLTFQSPQAFLLGFLLMGALLPIYIRAWRRAQGLTGVRGAVFGNPTPRTVGPPPTGWRRWLQRQRDRYGAFLRDTGAVVVRVPALVAAGAVIVVPAYVTFYLLGSGATASSSSLAVPLTTFTGARCCCSRSTRTSTSTRRWSAPGSAVSSRSASGKPSSSPSSSCSGRGIFSPATLGWRICSS
jgi:hypothetical protein